MDSVPIVCVVDDDSGMRKSLSLLLQSESYLVETFSTADAFLTSPLATQASCLILDIRMPGMSGLELQEHLSFSGINLPIIMISAHADVSIAVKAMKQGSFDFLEKPYSPQVLLERIRRAIEKHLKDKEEQEWRSSFTSRLQDLTSREKEILNLVVAGKPSKLIADKLLLSVSTVDNHRAKIMKKLKAETTADLTRIALSADPSLARETSSI